MISGYHPYARPHHFGDTIRTYSSTSTVPLTKIPPSPEIQKSFGSSYLYRKRPLHSGHGGVSLPRRLHFFLFRLDNSVLQNCIRWEPAEESDRITRNDKSVSRVVVLPPSSSHDYLTLPQALPGTTRT